MPDDVRRPQPVSEDGRDLPLDHLDALCDFAREFPAWMKDGVPLSWRHFVYGFAFLARARARDAIRSASAGAIVQAAKDSDRRDWWQRQTIVAGW